MDRGLNPEGSNAAVVGNDVYLCERSEPIWHGRSEAESILVVWGILCE